MIMENRSFVSAQKMKFSIKDFIIKCDQIRIKLQIQSHLLKKSLMEKFIFLCSVWHIRLKPVTTNIHCVKFSRNTSYLSVFSPNVGKYRPEKTPYLDTFHAVRVFSDPHISVEGENLHILRNDSSMTDLFTRMNFATQVLYFKVKRKDIKERMFVYWREQKIILSLAFC